MVGGGGCLEAGGRGLVLYHPAVACGRGTQLREPSTVPPPPRRVSLVASRVPGVTARGLDAKGLRL